MRRLLLVTLFLDTLGYGLLLPVLPRVLTRFSDDAGAQAELFGLFMGIYAAAQLLAAPALGALSDRIGRRPVLLGSLLFAAMDYVLMAVAPTLGLLFFGRILSGLSGATLSVASAGLADLHAPEERARAFSQAGAAMSLGVVAGPALGGLLAVGGDTLPFWAAAALNLGNFVLAVVLLPRGRPRDPPQPGSLDPFRVLVRLFARGGRLAGALLLFTLAGRATGQLWALFTQRRFGWGTVEIGLSLGLVGIWMVGVQGWLGPALLAWVGEGRTARLGLGWGVVGLVALALSESEGLLLPILGGLGLSAVVSAPLQAGLSRRFGAGEQGELQGGLAALSSLTALLGPPLYTWSFARIGVGSPFLLAAAFCLTAWILAGRALRPGVS